MSKRFWTSAAVAAVPGGYAVLLDGKPLRLPGGVDLTVTAPALAEAIAAEWQDAGACFGPDDVPLTGLAGAAQERVAANRAGMVESLIGYARADLLCYRAAQPAALAAAQHAAWQPWLDWAAQRHGAALRVTTELRAIDQPAASLAALRTALAAQSDAYLAALGLAIPALGSCVLGLALADGALTPLAALEASALDELYQQARWGKDAEAADRRARLLREIEHAFRFMELCRNDPGRHTGAPRVWGGHA